MLNKNKLIILLLIILICCILNLKAAPVPEEEDTSALKGILTLLSAFSIEFIKNQRYEFETGIITTGYNDIQIPGNSGSLFSLSDDLKADMSYNFRFKLVQPIAEKHRLIFMYAPLKIKSSGKIQKIYQEEFFEFGEMSIPTNQVPDLDFNGEYRLDTYRQSYMYDIIKLSKTQISAGASVEIRDEAIKLTGGDYYGKRSDSAVVPSVNLKIVNALNDKISLLAEADVLIDSKNRAEDIYLGMSYKILKDSKLNVGYRILERKTDKAEIFNSAVFHYLTIGVDLNP